MPRSRRWAWYFGVLALLGAIAVTAPLVVNLRAQLTPEKLEEAEARWRERGPSDYDLHFQERVGSGLGPVERHLVVVRGGKVVRVSRLEGDKEVPEEDLPSSEVQAYGVAGLFRRIGRHLDEDRQAGARNYATAAFDPKTGCPLRYVRLVRASRERLEWVVELLPPRHPR